MRYFVKPWQHQLEAINTAKDLPEYALFQEMGTGKSATAINILRHWMCQAGRHLRTVVLCPPIVIDQWCDEFNLHSKLGPYCVPLKGTGRARVKILEGVMANPTRSSIIITNYETLLMKDCYRLLKEYKPEALIGDESHKLKNIQAKRTKLAVELSDLTSHRLILTGSPVLNSPMDLFAQYRVLDKGKTFGENFFVFRARYFYDANAHMRGRPKYFPNWKPRKNIEEELNQKVYRKAMRVEKDACLDLPPFVRKEIKVEMSKEQKQAYEEMKNDLITYIEDKAAVANIALTKMLRLQQIVTGHLILDDGSIHKMKSVPRVEALKELLRDITPDHKVIVWAAFKDNYRQIREICDGLKINYVEIHGEVSAKQRTEAIESFRSDDSTRVVIASQKAGGVGLNLIEASVSIYYSRTHSLEDDLQSEARNYRGGSERHEKVTRIDLVCPGSVDTAVLSALRKKMNMADKILDMKKQLEIGC